MGKPFLEERKEIIALDSKEMASVDMAKTVYTNITGSLMKRLIDRKLSVGSTIKKNKLPLFSQLHKRAVTKDAMKVSTLKSDCLFAQLYIACKIRDSSLEDLFAHENQAYPGYPPSLSYNEDLNLGTKAHLNTCLDGIRPEYIDKHDVPAVILDGAALVNMLPPHMAKTFGEYALHVFAPFVLKQLQ